MTTDLTPEVGRIAVEGGTVTTYTFGSGDDVVLLLNGGPGVRSKHLQLTHARLATKGFRVVTYDQLGTGESDKPDDASLWTIERYAREVEAVRAGLGLDHIQLYGHSWGAMLAIEYTLTYPAAVRTLVVADGVADMPFHRREVDRLRADFGSEFVRMMRTHELAGRLDHPEYKAAETLLFYRHICRLVEWPAELLDDMVAGSNESIYKTMIGAEYYATGNLRNWVRTPDLHRIEQPVLVLTGEHDALTPEEAMAIHEALPDSRLHCFEGVAHMPFWEAPEEYFRVLEDFLTAHRLEA